MPFDFDECDGLEEREFYEDDLLSWEEEQVFRDHEGMDDFPEEEDFPEPEEMDDDISFDGMEDQFLDGSYEE